MYEEFENQIPDSYPQEAPGKKSGWTTGKVVALALSCSLIAGALGAGIATFISQEQGGSVGSHMLIGNRDNVTLQTIPVDTGRLMTAAEVYAANVNSTVGITTSVTTNFFGYQTTSAASGSGFILTNDGYILTNYHVVEGSNSITVSFYDGTSLPAKLIGYDASNDIAVLKVEGENLTPVVLGSSDNLNVGDTVLAIGNPLGELTFSLTSGSVSALNRKVTFSGGVNMNLIQTDCAINSGNSGGALFNLYGEVIGITNAKYSGSSGGGASIDNIGFAIPINRVRGIVESIIEKGYVSKPYIGVTVSDVGTEAQSYGLPAGAAIRSVVADSPAHTAGLQTGDIITQVNGDTIAGQADLSEKISASQVGDKMSLTVYRKGSSVTVEVTVGENIQTSAQEQQQWWPFQGARG